MNSMNAPAGANRTDRKFTSGFLHGAEYNKFQRQIRVGSVKFEVYSFQRCRMYAMYYQSK